MKAVAPATAAGLHSGSKFCVAEAAAAATGWGITAGRRRFVVAERWRGPPVRRCRRGRRRRQGRRRRRQRRRRRRLAPLQGRVAQLRRRRRQHELGQLRRRHQTRRGGIRPPAGAWFDSTAASVGAGGTTAIDAVVALTRAGRDRSASVIGANVTGVSVPAVEVHDAGEALRLRLRRHRRWRQCEEDDAGVAPLASGGVLARLLLTITDGLAPWWPLDVHAKFICCRSKKRINIQETKPITTESIAFNNRCTNLPMSFESIFETKNTRGYSKDYISLRKTISLFCNTMWLYRFI